MIHVRCVVVAILAGVLVGCANTGEAELRAPAAPIHVWTNCVKDVEILHRIVTHNTPRPRDLFGKLGIVVKSGDPAAVRLYRRGSIVLYAPGSRISVVERGHFGWGVHTWHEGIETFKLAGVKPGTQVELEASVDPDPEPEGDGAPTKLATFEVIVPRPISVKLADANWNPVDWKTVILRSGPLLRANAGSRRVRSDSSAIARPRRSTSRPGTRTSRARS